MLNRHEVRPDAAWAHRQGVQNQPGDRRRSRAGAPGSGLSVPARGRESAPAAGRDQQDARGSQRRHGVQGNPRRGQACGAALRAVAADRGQVPHGNPGGLSPPPDCLAFSARAPIRPASARPRSGAERTAARRRRAAGPHGPASGVPAFRAFEPFPKRLEGLCTGTGMTEGKGIRMPLYEHVFLTRQDASAQQVEELTAQFKGVIEQMGGKVAKTEQWGVKSLSYRLRKNRKAHFTLFNIEAPPAALNEIERQQRLSEDVLRYLTVRVHEHEEGPSAMMRKVDRDRERDDRGFGFRDRDRGGFRDRDRGEHRRDRERERDGRPPREGYYEESSPGTATEE